MRIVRTFGLALIAAAILPAAASAQSAAQGTSQGATQGPRDFKDSWFWGIRGGSTTFTAGADGSSRVYAPSVGFEWLITRSRVALNLSVDQSFFDDQAGVFDPTVAGSVRPVSISDMRSYQGSVFFFPKQYGSMRPYAGLGVALNVIQNADPQGTFANSDSQSEILTTVEDQTSRASAIFTLGVQAQVQRASLFVQGASMPTRHRFLLNGSANTFQLQAGVRYNLVGAIEKF